MRLTVVNPNTSAAFRTLLKAQLSPLIADQTVLRVVSPVIGFGAIEGFRDEAYASVGVCEVVETEQSDGADGFLIACFGDTGLFAAREVADGPVVGMTEAAIQAASMIAERFAIVTLPRRTRAHSDRVVAHLGMAHRCSVRGIDVSVGTLEEEAEAAFPALLASARDAVDDDGAEAIILGCAGMATLADPLSDRLGMPVIDGVSIGLKMLEGLVACGLRTSKASTFARPTLHDEPVPHLSRER
ncbi:aspartate/glutamate racemase family protein [Jannaschia sp. 2305UL9-9]|uniref:aspartate/glutamate racemase family protein n=1 Tax=Jannaschia sp. 2305UL9-9 TaxID=3121638 RepID=UPI003528C6FF